MQPNIPNTLTWARIVLIPLFVGVFYLPASWLGLADKNFWACVMFVLAAVTDWFDGYLARSFNQVSALGRFLDPIADKLLVGAVLMMLAAFDRVSPASVLPAVVILLREILVSGLREFLAEIRIGMPVSRLAKWKTGIQMVALSVLLVGDYGPSELPVRLLGEVCLWVAAVLTMVTGWDYLRSGLKHMRPNPTKADS